jgi:hypothetical protein
VRTALLLYHLRGSVGGHSYNPLTRLGRRVHGNSNSRRKRHHHRPSILSPSVQSEDTTSGSTTTETITLAQAMSLAEAPSEEQMRAQTPAGIPIPSSPSPSPQSSPHPPGDLSTAPTSFVTAPPTIVSRTTDSGGDGRTPDMLNEGAGGTEHYALPHIRGFVPH